MNALLSLLFAALPVETSNQTPRDWVFQGRFSAAERMRQHADRCGIRNARLAVMHGALSFHNPEEAGAELTIPAAEMTKAAKACIALPDKHG